MNEQQILARRRNAGFAAFFFSGVCAISSGVVVSLLQEQYGFAYGVTGTLLSLMNIGNLTAGFLSGVLPGLLGGMKRSVLLLSLGYLVGYGLMGFTGVVALLGLGFFLVGAAKGQVINTCTVLVGDSSPDRTRGMNLMHSCYACGALLCPFAIAAAGRAGQKAPLFLLALVGAALWLAFAVTPMEQGGKKAGGKIDWSFPAQRPVLAADGADLLPERRRDQRHRLDGHVLSRTAASLPGCSAPTPSPSCGGRPWWRGC